MVLTSRTAERRRGGRRELVPIAPRASAPTRPTRTPPRPASTFALERFGSVDILVNNAGTNPAFGPLVDQDHARFAKTIDTNLWAPILWTRLAWHAWMAEHGGTVVNTASLGGLDRQPEPRHLPRHQGRADPPHPPARARARAAGARQRRGAGHRPHPALRGCCGSDREDEVAGLTPLGGIGVPSDVGSAVAFLASDQASWITGETLVIDGGQLLQLAQAEAGQPA